MRALRPDGADVVPAVGAELAGDAGSSAVLPSGRRRRSASATAVTRGRSMSAWPIIWRSADGRTASNETSDEHRVARAARRPGAPVADVVPNASGFAGSDGDLHPSHVADLARALTFTRSKSPMLTPPDEMSASQLVEPRARTRRRSRRCRRSEAEVDGTQFACSTSASNICAVRLADLSGGERPPPSTARRRSRSRRPAPAGTPAPARSRARRARRDAPGPITVCGSEDSVAMSVTSLAGPADRAASATTSSGSATVSSSARPRSPRPSRPRRRLAAWPLPVMIRTA